jgi:hypothetical protein
VPTKETAEPGELGRHLNRLVGDMDGIYPSDDRNMISPSIFQDHTEDIVVSWYV